MSRRPASSDPTQRRARGPQAIGAVTAPITRPLLGKRGLAEGDLIARWDSIVGPLMASYVLPEQVRFPKGRRDGGELTLRVPSGPFALQIQHDAPTLLQRINGYFGYPAIARLKIVQAPLPIKRPSRDVRHRALRPTETAEITAQVDQVTDPDLRAALERLGKSMRSRQK